MVLFGSQPTTFVRRNKTINRKEIVPDTFFWALWRLSRQAQPRLGFWIINVTCRLCRAKAKLFEVTTHYTDFWGRNKAETSSVWSGECWIFQMSILTNHDFTILPKFCHSSCLELIFTWLMLAEAFVCSAVKYKYKCVLAESFLYWLSQQMMMLVVNDRNNPLVSTNSLQSTISSDTVHCPHLTPLHCSSRDEVAFIKLILTIMTGDFNAFICSHQPLKHWQEVKVISKLNQISILLFASLKRKCHFHKLIPNNLELILKSKDLNLFRSVKVSNFCNIKLSIQG